MKQKIILILIFVSSLIITFTPDMACNMIIIGLKEFDTFSNLKSLKYDNVILLIGLILALIIIGTKNTVDYGNVWIITVLTILPFLGLSVYFYFAYFKKGNPLKNNL
jgi:hypothetical protein